MPDLLIKVLNSEQELKAFPLQQAIILESSEKLEDSLLAANIALLREVQEYGLLNTSDLYNLNIGYVKESFNLVPLKIEMYTEDSKHLIKCTPKETLSPSSKYTLYLDKDLATEHVSVVKTLSVGPAQLELVDSEKQTLDLLGNTYKLKVTSNPFINATSNIIKFSLYINEQFDKTFTIDAKSSKNTFTFLNITLKVKDSAYGFGEEFSIESSGLNKQLTENLIINIVTAISSQIKPVDNIVPSQQVSNKDILEFYSKLEVQKELSKGSGDTADYSTDDWLSKEVSIEYKGFNKFLMTLRTLTTDNLDLEDISWTEGPAYNKYDLEDLGLYSDKDVFKLTPEILDSKTVLFTVSEVEDDL